MKRPTLKEINRKAEEMALEDAHRWLLELSEEFGDSVQKIADKYNKKLEAKRKEIERLNAMMAIENDVRHKGYCYIGGVDGRQRPSGGACSGSLRHSSRGHHNLRAERLRFRLQTDKLYDEIRKRLLPMVLA